MKEEEVKTWQQIIKRWKSSKLSQKRYCKERDINYSTFKGWRYRLLGKSNKVSSLLGRLLPLKLKNEDTNIGSLISGVEFKLNKVVIQVAELKFEQLKEIIKVLS